MGLARSGGAMAAVAATAAEVAVSLAGLAGLAGRVDIAAVNGPASVVVSGDADAVDEVAARWAADGRDVKRLRVSHAFHSHHMDPVLEQFGRDIAGLDFRAPAIPMVSNLTGTLATAEQLAAVDYWVEHVREPVRYADGVAALAGLGVAHYLELGPGGVLTGMAAACLPDDDDRVLVTALPGGVAEPRGVARALARLGAAGLPVAWTGLPDGRRADLPTYAFQRHQYWLDVAPRPTAGAEHPLLVSTVELADGGAIATGLLSRARLPWLADHRVSGAVLLPGTAFVEMALRAGAQVGCADVAELVLEAPATVPPDTAVDVQVAVAAPADGQRRFEVFCRQAGAAWARHATGVLAALPDPQWSGGDGPWPPRDAVAVDLADCYAVLAARGYDYGPAFRGLRGLWRRSDEVFADVALPAELVPEARRFLVHPVLLDTALHAVLLSGAFGIDTALALPFSWSGVSVRATGASRLLVRVTGGSGSVTVELADSDGRPLGVVRSLLLRAADPDRLRTMAAAAPPAATAEYRDLYQVEWDLLSETGASADPADWSVVGTRVLAESECYPDWLVFQATHAAAAAAVVVLAWPGDHDPDVPAVAQARLARLLEIVQQWCAEDRWARSRLVLLTHGAVAEDQGTAVSDLAGAAAWGLVRTAQTEHPGRFVLVDTDDDPDSMAALAVAVGSGEPQSVIRRGQVRVPRLARPGTVLSVPDSAAWRLAAVRRGSLDGLALIDHPAAAAALAPTRVRVRIRAAGVNFRDVVSTLGLVDDDRPLGSEAAGVVTEIGEDVTDLAVGDRVMGIFPDGAFGPVAATDRDLLVPIPREWTFEQAAAVPVAFATAYHGLVNLAKVQPGERVLVHAAAGAVGMAAVQIARYLGAEVYGTASPHKWPALLGYGMTSDRMASSRTLEFEQRFAAGFDVVLDSLAGEFVDASLRLTRPGGRFLEIGKTDIRDTAMVARDHPRISYRAYDLLADVEPRSQGEMLRELAALVERGVLSFPPLASWPVRRAPEAFRYMSMARHVGKLVLTLPPGDDGDGTVLVTGASGALAGLFARHLVLARGVRNLLLLSRGPARPELIAELTELGAAVRWAACDVADRDALARVLAGIAPQHPLTGVFHLAGALADGVIESLTTDSLDAVMAPKAVGAWNLHTTTLDAPLTDFVVFSSVAGTLGTAGQGNYAAANAFLDALVSYRRGRGLPGSSWVWGMWENFGSAMTGRLSEVDRARLRTLGLAAITAEQGTRMFDAGTELGSAVLVAAAVAASDPAAAQAVSPLLRPLLAAPARRRAAPDTPTATVSFTDRLAGLDPVAARDELARLVGRNVAAVLGYDTDVAPPVATPLRDLGFDSLAGVELRNRLNSRTGLRTPTTLVFDYPTIGDIVGYLVDALGVARPRQAAPDDTDGTIRDLLAGIPVATLRRAGLLDALLRLAAPDTESETPSDASSVAFDDDDDLDSLDVDGLVRLALGGNDR
jgi:NADPH:quinone reductase-like Zn-dependent oxidoreductase/acyl carrier protein